MVISLIDLGTVESILVCKSNNSCMFKFYAKTNTLNCWTSTLLFPQNLDICMRNMTLSIEFPKGSTT